MKIICVGRNYVEHIRELENDVPEDPVVFLKPSTALLKNGMPFIIPEWSNNIHYESEIVLKISKQGKYIQQKFAHKYFNEISVGIDFTARDVQQTLKEKSLPWELSKSFDGSAAVGKFLDKEKFPLPIHFSLFLNGKQVQSGNTSKMIFSFERIISFVSMYFTLQQGDIIFTGTPAGVGKVNAGDLLEARLEDELVLRCEIK
ncbi:MAG: fumarylacetoacetate hydrolase family protein [Chitinophagales bacterium]|nr:fumarylacetoacetate hydrolase family protein [Chitinophagales bacterium]MDW8273663.1 fumarylacetoacetate hydrolase family protein [Chitinophagales bacterium]